MFVEGSPPPIVKVLAATRDQEPVLACPPTLGYRLRKLVRWPRGPVLAAALILAALLAGIVGTTLGLFQAHAALDEKERARQQAEDARADATAKAKWANP